MNIGIITTWFERGAAYVSKQFEDILSENHNVFIYARGGEKYDKVNPRWNKPNVTWGKRSIFQINATPIVKNDFKRWIKRNNIEVLLFNEQQWWPPVIWAKELGLKTGSYIDYYTEQTVPFYWLFDFLICNTKRHYSVFKDHSQCYYIPWGTDTNLFVPNEKNDIDKDKLVIFNSCGMNPDRKGVLPIIKAIDYLNTEKIKLIVHSQVNLLKFYPNHKELIQQLITIGFLGFVTYQNIDFITTIFINQGRYPCNLGASCP